MSQYVLLRIQSLQKELESLKKIVSHQLLQSQRKTTYIKGLWKDFEINDDDFADARSNDLQDEIKWDNSFAKSQSKLVASARIAKQEIAEGKAVVLDFNQHG